jgi:hypothetical protein
MNKIYAAFENFFGGGKTYSPSDEQKLSSVTVTSYSQTNVLRQRMKEEKMSHGQTVKANLSPVRLEMDRGEVIMYFCQMKSIEITELINSGDEASIPSQTKVDSLAVPSDFKPGFYDLKNVILTSNGTIQVIGTSSTTWSLSDADNAGRI